MPDRAKKQSRGRGHYSEEFKRRAVAQMAVGDKTLNVISKLLGVSVVSLIKWRRDLQAAPIPPLAAPGPNSPEWASAMSQIEQLRLELARVTEERDRLRKSIALLVGAM